VGNVCNKNSDGLVSDSVSVAPCGKTACLLEDCHCITEGARKNSNTEGEYQTATISQRKENSQSPTHILSDTPGHSVHSRVNKDCSQSKTIRDTTARSGNANGRRFYISSGKGRMDAKRINTTSDLDDEEEFQRKFWKLRKFCSKLQQTGNVSMPSAIGHRKTCCNDKSSTAGLCVVGQPFVTETKQLPARKSHPVKDTASSGYCCYEVDDISQQLRRLRVFISGSGNCDQQTTAPASLANYSNEGNFSFLPFDANLTGDCCTDKISFKLYFFTV